MRQTTREAIIIGSAMPAMTKLLGATAFIFTATLGTERQECDYGQVASRG